MNKYRNVSILTLLFYVVFLFINPLVVALVATTLMALNVLVLFAVEFYAKKITSDSENRKSAELLMALRKLNKL